MATEIWVTDGVVRVTSAGAKQPLASAIDVSKFDQLDLLLSCVGVEGAGNLTVSILGGMSTESEDGWVTLQSFAALSAVNTFDKKNVPQLLKYVRWSASTTATAGLFSIRGMARNN